MSKSSFYRKDDTKSEKKQVTFQNVEVREYELGLCDNPECYRGPAIGLGWNYTLLSKDTLDDYEKNQAPPRPSKQLYLNREFRQEIMKKTAFTSKEIRTVTLAKAKTRAQRSRTLQNIHFAPVEERLESLTRKMKRIVFRRKKDAELYTLWPECKRVVDRRLSAHSTETLDTTISQHSIESI